MNLLAQLYSYGDGLKRKVNGLLSDPIGAASLGATRMAEDQQGLLGLMDQAGYTPGSKSVLQRPQDMQQARNALADAAMQSYGGLLGTVGKAAQLTDAERARAMEAMGMERGYYRGGPSIVDGKKSGDWYTRSRDEAADYAKRFPNADVREYAVPKNTLKHEMGYSSKLAQDIAAKIETMGDKGSSLAKLLRENYPSGQITGIEAWRSLSKYLGEDDAMAVLGSLGFKGVRGVNSQDYLRVFPGSVVRDANLAKFDPSRQQINDIYGAASPAFMGLLATGAGAGLVAADRMKSGEGKK